MELRLVILSVACFSCLIPSAVSFNLPAAKAVASQAAQDIVNIGANTVVAKKEAVAKAASDIASIVAQSIALKGEAVKTAATSIAGAVIKGAMSIGATIVKAGFHMIAVKFGAKPTMVYEPSEIVIQEPVLLEKPKPIVVETIVEKPVVVECDKTVQIPPISTVSVDVKPQFWDIPPPPQLSQSVWTVNEAGSTFEIVAPSNSPYVYEFVQSPQVYGPLVETFKWEKK